ncbi:hypothetical protein D3C81_662670 [compost metagenome]
MDITRHFKERYCERILGMKDKTEIKQYIVQNDENIKSYSSKLMEFAKFIWKGQLGTDNITRNYFIRDDIIIVASTDNSALITLYKCDFKFPEETNRKVIKDLLIEIDKLHNELEETELLIKDEVDLKQIELENIEVQIKSFEKQIEILKFRQGSLKDDIKSSVGMKQFLMEDIKKYATMLCNSIDYKSDLAELKKN